MKSLEVILQNRIKMFLEKANSLAERIIANGRAVKTEQEQSLVSCGKYLQSSAVTEVVKNHRTMLAELDKNLASVSAASTELTFPNVQALQGKTWWALSNSVTRWQLKCFG